ncbi:MAG: DUF438 domain-containing protein [Calditrichales bacterium]|nr:MAG: DUF438 domain-containing protein [Calditrichales bacterium]
MSEIINNRQQRIDIMKGLIRQLHQGVPEEKIKEQLETMLDQAEYADVFLMEVQLIQEGIPQESIQELCDTHTRVLKKHLDLQETPETIPGHPVHTFVQENKELTKTTQQIRYLVEQMGKMDPQLDATESMREIQGHLNLLMDVDKHYRRKENLLFPYFEKKDFPGPPAVMWSKHDETREMLKLILDGLHQINRIDGHEAQAFNTLAVIPALDAIEDMIYKEEKIMLPTAMDLLTEQEWYEIYIQSEEIGYCIYVPEFTWQPVGGLHKEINEVAAKGNRIQMPTGSFDLSELIASFSIMPCDLTFVDKDDTVRYFSPGKDRVFDRTRAILGRKVQYCHPPKSVHIVNQILKDFKAGTQERARFWIQMGPKMIYIVYYALRDDKGGYLGTLEVTQDVTEIRQLDGERRLLEYDENK